MVKKYFLVLLQIIYNKNYPKLILITYYLNITFIMTKVLCYRFKF